MMRRFGRSVVGAVAVSVVLLAGVAWGQVAETPIVYSAPGTHNLPVDYPAQIEIYALGGGGGGQGGYEWDDPALFAPNQAGTGGGGGGGAAVYARFNVTGFTQFNITVGGGGNGGGLEWFNAGLGTHYSSWRSGYPGSSGDASTVTFNLAGSSRTITAGGGVRAANNRPETGHSQILNGGAGGTSSISSTTGFLSSNTTSGRGGEGGQGRPNSGTRGHGGSAGSLLNIGTIAHFPGGYGGGTGGTGGLCQVGQPYDSYPDIPSEPGEAGRVVIVITRLHTITFNSNGGSTTPSSITNILNGTSGTLPAGPTRTGYTFAGWNTNSSGTGTNYSANSSYMPTGDITLYARWTPITYNITYNPNGGTIHPSTTQYTYTIETPTITLLSPTRTDQHTNTPYTFLGWYNNSNFTGSSVTSIPVGSTGNKTFYAKWEFIPFTFDLNGAFDESKINRNYLTWGYSNPLNETGRFYVYRRVIFPTEENNWTLLNPSGISVTSGSGMFMTYTDSIGISHDPTYLYHVAFVKGTITPSATTPPTDNSETISINTAISKIPLPVHLTATFNQRTEKSGSNGQVMLDWKYYNLGNKSGHFYVYRREGAGDWALLNPSGLSVVNAAINLPMTYVDNSIDFYKTYEYGVAFSDGTNVSDTQVVSRSTQLEDGTPGMNAYTPFKQTSDTYVVDGITYRDIYGTGQRNLNNRDKVFERLLNSKGFQFSDNSTHLSRWMDVGKLIAPLNNSVSSMFTEARRILNDRRTDRSVATTATSAGALTNAASIGGAAFGMLKEFNDRSGYAIGDSNYVPVGDIDPALYSANKNSSPIFWVLDRNLVHANDVDDDRNAGDSNYVYYGTGLIFHDLKLSYLETGDPFYSSVSGITGIIDEPFAGFRYTFEDIKDAVVSGVRNLSSTTGSYTQSWTDHRGITVGNGVSDINGYEMSEARGTGASYSVSYTADITKSNTRERHFTVSGKVGSEVGVEGSVGVLKGSVTSNVEVGNEYGEKVVWTTDISQGIAIDTTRSTTHEIATSEMFSRTNSRDTSITISNTMEYSVGVPLPPHTQVMLRQGRSNLTLDIDYDYPVVLSYKVTVVALGSRRSGGVTENYMKKIATYGMDKDTTNKVSPLEVDAAENFNVLWGYRNTPANVTFHSVDSIILNDIWTKMKQTTGGSGVSNFCLYGFEEGLRSTANAMLATRFIMPVAEGMTKEKPMTVVRGTISQTFESMNSEIFEFQPIHALHRIEASNIDAIDLPNGSQYYADRIELVGRNVHGVDFYGFHKDKGGWVLTNADGSFHDGSIARLMPEAGTGRPIVVADNNATGTVFLRYIINSDVYSYDGLSGYMTPEDLGMRTAIIPVNVTSAGLLSIVVQPSGGTVPVVDTVSYPLSVTVATNINVYYQWYVNTVPSNKSGSPITGAHGSTYNAPLGTAGVFYYYVVVSTDAPNIDPVVSSLAMLTVESGTVSVLTPDRVIPGNMGNDAAVVVPVNVSAFEVSVGPNPVRKSDNGVNIFLTGKRIDKGELTVYDGAGNVVRKINIRDAAVLGNNGRRIIGKWDLRDARGRPVAEGTYLLRGTVKTIDGNRERVSVIVGVR